MTNSATEYFFDAWQEFPLRSAETPFLFFCCAKAKLLLALRGENRDSPL